MISNVTLSQLSNAIRNKKLPSGEYEVAIECFDFDENALIIKYRIQSGDFRLKKIFDCIKNNEFAVCKIARIMRACNMEKVNHFTPSMLLGKCLKVAFQCDKYKITDYIKA